MVVIYIYILFCIFLCYEHKLYVCYILCFWCWGRESMLCYSCSLRKEFADTHLGEGLRWQSLPTTDIEACCFKTGFGDWVFTGFDGCPWLYNYQKLEFYQACWEETSFHEQVMARPRFWLSTCQPTTTSTEPFSSRREFFPIGIFIWKSADHSHQCVFVFCFTKPYLDKYQTMSNQTNEIVIAITP